MKYSCFRRDNRTSAVMRNYNTQTKERPVEVLGAGDARFILRKRIFLNPKALPQDLVEHHLIYAQAVNDIIKVHISAQLMILL